MKRKKPIFLTFLIVTVLAFAQEKTVAKLHVRGLKKTKVSYVEKIIGTKAGGKLDSLALEADIIRLKRLPLVSHAYYQVFYSHENQYNVFFDIEENFTLIPNANIWTATNQQFAYKVGLYDFNFLGRGIAFGGFYQNNGYDSYSINLRAPYFFTNKLGLAVNYQNWRSEEPLYFQGGSANYLYNNRSFEVLGLYEFNSNHKLQLGANFFTEKYEYLSGLTSDDIPRNLDVDKLLLKLVYDYDRLDYYYQYISGFRSLLYLQNVSSSNEYQDDFLIGWNDFYYYRRIGERGNLANRLRLGLSSNSNSPFAPFSVDNNLNIRGVGNVIDRGTGVVVLNTEYRQTLFEKNWFALQGNIFVDAGTWRNPGGDFNDFSRSQNLRVYPGFGLRFIHKQIYNAIFRIDYGYGVTKNASNGIVFGIGQYF
ncbi:MAG: outer membrane protein assembly factor [Flavobacteriaceae bacterium]|nr:outer membrane protein assembly factor [Flavobacteriaceae bacterium]